MFAVFGLVLGSAGLATAQGVNISSSDIKLRELGLPEINITVGPDGVDAPTELASGSYLITLHATGDYVAYLNFMQPPAGLSEEEATRLALDAAANDLVQPDWAYLGGTNTFDIGVPMSFAIHFEPGEYVTAASYYIPDQGSEEIMKLVPLTITSDATPVAGEATPVADMPVGDVKLEMTDDLAYIVSPDPVPAGPQIWELSNAGVHGSHHVVMTRIPEGVTADDIVADFGIMMSGTPTAGEPLMAQFTFVGYAALQYGGATSWHEFDLEPGTYAVICYILDSETFMLHVMDGMVTVFTVE